MDLYDADALITRDLATERKQTTTAFFLGLGAAVISTAALVCQPPLQHHPFLLIMFLCLCSAAPLSTLQLWLQNRGRAMLSEACGYTGVILSLPLLPYFFAASPPLILLLSRYEDQGRYRLVLTLVSLLQGFYKHNPLVPAYIKNALALVEAEALINLGRSDEAHSRLTEVNQAVDRVLSKGLNPDSWEQGCQFKGHLVKWEKLIGQDEIAALIWAETKKLAASPLKRTPNTAYTYEGLLWGAVAMKDYQAALSYAGLFREHYESAGLTSKCLAGSANAAQAEMYLGLDEREKAKIFADKALRNWSFYLTETAASKASPYFVLGKLAELEGELDLAASYFDKASCILRRRRGGNFVGLLKTLEAYSHCLNLAGRQEETALLEGEIATLRGFHALTATEDLTEEG